MYRKPPDAKQSRVEGTETGRKLENRRWAEIAPERLHT